MPTVEVKYRPGRSREQMLENLVDLLPGMVAPLMTIPGRELHDGGVTEKEILVDATPYSPLARNVNDLQVTVIAHSFTDRMFVLDDMTESLRNLIATFLADYDSNIKVGVSIWLVEMGYATI